MVTYKEEYSLETRLQDYQKLMSMWPDKIPIVAEKTKNSGLTDLAKPKMLCPENFRFSQFLACLRAKLCLNARQSLFVFINKKIITSDSVMKKVYEENRNEDGFLYVEYCENEYLG